MTEASHHAVMLLGGPEFWARRRVLLAMTMTASCPALPSFVRWNQSNQPVNKSTRSTRSTRSRQSPQITLELATQPLVYKRPFLSLFPPIFSSSLSPPPLPSLNLFFFIFFHFPLSPSLSFHTNKNGSMVSDMHPTVQVPSLCQWMGCHGCLGGRQYHNAGSDTSWFSRASDSRFNTCFRDELERLPTTACLTVTSSLPRTAYSGRPPATTSHFYAVLVTSSPLKG